MNPDENKALIRRWLRMGEQGFGGDFNEFFTPDYAGHLSGGTPQTLDDLIRLERGFAASFSNISYNVEDLIAVDDKVAAPRVMTGPRGKVRYDWMAAQERLPRAQTPGPGLPGTPLFVGPIACDAQSRPGLHCSLWAWQPRPATRSSGRKGCNTSR